MKVIGFIMLIVPFALCIWGSIAELGWKGAAAVWAIVIAIVAWTGMATYLILR